MCTVVYMPLPQGPAIASLRDEKPARVATHPQIIIGNHGRTLMPLDTKGGSWAGVNDLGHVVVLLNGAFVNHSSMAPYVKSRGLVVRELLAAKSPINNWRDAHLHGIEPFTLIVYAAQTLHRLVWDGHAKHEFELDAAAPHIFSSATLYDREASESRSMAFAHWWNKESNPNEHSLFQLFHSVADAYNGFIIHRHTGLRTISYSYISLTTTGPQFLYTDFLSGISSEVSLALSDR